MIRRLIFTLSSLILLMTSNATAQVERTKAGSREAGQLETAIRAIAGFPQRGLSVYRTLTGLLVIYDESILPLTPTQLTSLDAVIAMHVDDSTSTVSLAAAQAELLSNPICQATLATINSTLVLNLATIQQLARCLVAERQLRGAVKQ